MGLALQTEIRVCVLHPDVNTGSLHSSTKSPVFKAAHADIFLKNGVNRDSVIPEQSRITQLKIRFIKSYKCWLFQ